ncbi:MAG: hypothetical protein ABIB43_00380 [archaeon]
MNWSEWAVIAVLVFILMNIFFKKYASALFYDYIVDGALSFADNFIGVGLVGLDIGDWIAAIIIFSREKKISGKMVAFLVAWEAANFLPLSLIPVVGEGIEIFFNFFPAVFLSRVLFSKFGKADKAQEKLEANISLGEKTGSNMKKYEKILKIIKKLNKKSNPIDALKLTEKCERKVIPEVARSIRSTINDAKQEVQETIDYLTQSPDDVNEEITNIIAGAEDMLSQADAAVNNGELTQASELVSNARNSVKEAMDGFDVSSQTL